MTIATRFLQRLSPLTTAAEVDWERLYAAELPRVFNFFRYRVGADAAEDLTATTFEKAWRARARYRHDRAAFATWLFTIARHVATDYFRQAHADLSLDTIARQSTAHSLDDVVEQHAEFARLHRLLAALPDRERELIALKYGADLSNRAIAKLMGLSESNVGTIVYRVVSRLRTQWDSAVGQ